MKQLIAFALIAGAASPLLAQNRPELSQPEPIVVTNYLYPGAGLDFYTKAERELTEEGRKKCGEQNLKLARIQDVVIQIKANYKVNSQGKTSAATYPRTILTAMVQCEK